MRFCNPPSRHGIQVAQPLFRKRSSRLTFWNDPNDPGNAFKCIDYPSARAETHRFRQLVSSRNNPSRRSRRLAAIDCGQAPRARKKSTRSSFSGLAYTPTELVFNHLQAGFFKDLPP